MEQQTKTPLEWALFYASKGWAVFPCDNEKRPMTEHGFKNATTDPEKVTEYFTRYPNANIGIATGKVSGLFLLDIDIKKGNIGDQSLRELEDEYGKLPHTVSEITWSGGQHFFFKYPECGMPNVPFIRPGIEIKGDGGYAIVAPSKYKGECGEGDYCWEVSSSPEDTELAEAPEWLLKITLDILSDKISTDPAEKTVGDISITDVLSKANISTKTIGGQLVCSHPVHGSTNGNNFVVHPEKNVWRCFRCGSGGGALSLIAVLEGIIPCDQARPRGLKEDNFIKTLDLAEEKYGFKVKHSHKGNRHIKVASEIQKTHKIIYCANDYYEYQGGYYKKIDEAIIQGWIKQLVGDQFRRCLAEEVKYAIQTDTYLEPDKLNTSNFLNLKNGLYNLEDETLKPHTPDIYSTIRLNVSYDKKATCPKWCKAVHEILEGDQGKVATLQEYFGLCLTKETRYHRALFMLGEGANGKSTILYILENIIGEQNRTALPLEVLNNPLYIANLYNKLVNISIETNAKSEVYDAYFKAIVAGDTVKANPKYKEPFDFRPYCKLIYALNTMPRVNDKTYAFYRRLLILKFNRQFQGNYDNKNLKYELLKEIDGIFLWCIEGLRNLRQNGDFKPTDEMVKEVEEYRRENNNVLLFVEEEYELGPDNSISKKDSYIDYSEWCKTNGYKPLSKKRLSMEFIKQFHLEPDSRDNFGDRVWLGIGKRRMA